jgi:hypothetical protein
MATVGSQRTNLADGLYAVLDDEHGICAGLIVEDGHVVDCAPILRKRLAWWLRYPCLRKVTSNGPVAQLRRAVSF